MLTLFSFSRNIIVLVLFVIAVASVTMNIVITLIDVSRRLGERPTETRVILGGSVDLGKGRFDIIDNICTLFLISFHLLLLGSRLLLF